MKIKVWVGTRYINSKDYEIIELEDDTPAEEIEAHARDAMFGMISWGWEIVTCDT